MPDQQQKPIEGLEACRVRFVDVSLNEIDNPPGIDDYRKFTVTAVCVAHTRERMKDGELRHTAKMRVVSLQPDGESFRPSSAPATTPLFSVPGGGDSADHEDWDQGDDGDND